jgi:hypothetical protein
LQPSVSDTEALLRYEAVVDNSEVGGFFFPVVAFSVEVLVRALGAF